MTSESVEAVRGLCRVTDADWARMMQVALGKDPALSGCKGHESEPMALRGVPSEVPGSTSCSHEWVRIARMGGVLLEVCRLCQAERRN